MLEGIRGIATLFIYLQRGTLSLVSLVRSIEELLE